jgi:hypothetical protein
MKDENENPSEFQTSLLALALIALGFWLLALFVGWAAS